MGFLVARITLPSGFLIPIALALTNDRAVAKVIKAAGEFHNANPELPMCCEKEQVIFQDTPEVQTVFRVYMLPLLK